MEPMKWGRAAIMQPAVVVLPTSIDPFSYVIVVVVLFLFFVETMLYRNPTPYQTV